MVNKTFFIHIVISFFFLAPVLQAQEKTFTVVIDAGHGGKDPGAKGPTINEKAINLAVTLKLGKLISDNHKDVKVIYTRKTDVFVELDERANIANRNKADLFICIHANAVKRTSVYGAETFTLGQGSSENLDVVMRENSVILLEEDYLQKYEGFDPNSTESYIIFEFMQNKHMEQSVNFASEIQKEFKSANRYDRGVKQDRFLVLLKTSMPAVLVELGFVTNREEERYLKSTAGQDKLAKAIYNAFVKYKREYDKRLGIPSNGTGTVATTTTATETPKSNTASKPSASSQKNTAPTPKNRSGQTVYKVQILTAPKKLSLTDSKLKGYKGVDFYVDNGTYKYTVGETTGKNEITNLWNKVRKDFKDAFIIEFKDGKRIK